MADMFAALRKVRFSQFAGLAAATAATGSLLLELTVPQVPALTIATIASSTAVAALLAGAMPLQKLGQILNRVASGELTDRDDLSGCLNRRRFMEIVEERLSAIRSNLMQNRAAGEYSLLLIDVDHFKALNDGYGHSCGDDVLRALGRCARDQRDWVVGRIGGDEFAILIDGSDSRAIADAAYAFMERLKGELKSNEHTRAYQGISIGVASTPHDATLVRDLFHKADTALYAGKRSGRGQVTFYHRDMEREQIEQRRIARDLHAAILLNQLDLYYQPIVDADGVTVGAEALVRWRNQIGGTIAPDKFVPIAEQSDLIDKLGEWVFQRACRDLDASGFQRISVNVSGAQLKHDRLVPMLRRVLQEHACAADRFALEITETVVLTATPRILEIIQELRGMGFKIALDDFGTGNNSFALLRDMPVDIVKIDKSYTQRLESDKIAQVFVSAVGEIAKSLDMLMVAEGVETLEQQRLAHLAGAIRFQGYLHARPQPLATVIAGYRQELRRHG